MTCEYCGKDNAKMATKKMCRECKAERVRALWKKRKNEGRPYHATASNKRTPKQRLAQKYVEAAIKRGLLVVPERCESCGAFGNAPFGRLDAHHVDYDRPGDVRWLCRKCHRHLHDHSDSYVNADGPVDREAYRLRPISVSASKYIGVMRRESRGSWVGYIKVNGRFVFQKSFHTEIEAARAYDAAAVKLHGKFARLNFPAAIGCEVEDIIADEAGRNVA